MSQDPGIHPLDTGSGARGILKRWANNRLPLESPEVQEWIYNVLGYFKNCYQGENGSWNTSDITIDRKNERDQWLWQDEHCGVHFIRKYYPEFEAAPAHFERAYWGTKPGVVNG